jgi:enoyl-CoA hydratase/carnithine racemase
LSSRAAERPSCDDLVAGSLETALSTKYEPIEQYATSEDVKEGRRAFAEKRAPNWTGQ